MAQPPLDPADHAQIAEKLRSGEYFREARRMYDITVHDPMSERYVYILITVVAGLIAFISFMAAESLFPLQRSVPFIYGSTDTVEDLPEMKSLLEQKGQTPDAAMIKFLINNYVELRENYTIDTIDRALTGVRSQSSPEVFGQFQYAMDPRNPQSPVTLYQRHSDRKIDIVSEGPAQGTKDQYQVIFNATVAGLGQIKKSRYSANITFRYNGLTLDDTTNQVKPIEFIVTNYTTTRLEDLK